MIKENTIISAGTIHLNSLMAMMENCPNDLDLGRQVRAYLHNVRQVHAGSMVKTSEEWKKEYNYQIDEYTGWDKANLQHSWFEEKITKKEFERRLFSSRISVIPLASRNHE